MPLIPHITYVKSKKRARFAEFDAGVGAMFIVAFGPLPGDIFLEFKRDFGVS